MDCDHIQRVGVQIVVYFPTEWGHKFKPWRMMISHFEGNHPIVKVGRIINVLAASKLFAFI